jgi:DNA repair exonuclease SbcCD nuclease subunit
MSKIFLISDTHIGLGFPNKVEKWFKVHQEYFSEFFIPLLRERVRPGDIVVHLGDLFDNRNVIPINILNYGMDVVEQISKIAPLHILVGNHDLWSKSASEINTVRPFRWIPNVYVYDQTSRLEFNGIKICMMPYIEKRIEQINLINQFSDCDYLFCHSDLNGCKMHLTSVAHKNSDKIDIEDFRNFKSVKSGHIHLVQSNKHFSFVGSPFQMDRNDYGDQKGIFILDTNDGSEEWVPNLISPKFVKVKLVNESDIEVLNSLKGSKDYIDISISNSLLISNRKLRRKLEIILENGGFSSIEYIDDITRELEENPTNEKIDESIESINDISINLDYEDYIRQYILIQKYENTTFRDGLISEWDNLAKVYRESKS